MTHPQTPSPEGLPPDDLPDVPRKAPDEAPGILQQPERTKRWMRMLFIAAGVLLLLDLIYTPHFHSVVESGGGTQESLGIKGFYGIYAFLGLVVLIVGAKVLRAIVMRPEDYYDE
jgi:hypothetical protein